MSFLQNLFGAKEPTVLAAALDGEVKSVTEAPDPVFSQEMMGKGYVIFPSSGKVYAPIGGKIQTIFPTKHSVGLISDDGLEIIIHVGMDTVQLKGEGFHIPETIKEGSRVQKGDLLLEFDMETVGQNVPSLATPVVITNLGDRHATLLYTGQIRAGTDVLEIM